MECMILLAMYRRPVSNLVTGDMISISYTETDFMPVEFHKGDWYDSSYDGKSLTIATTGNMTTIGNLGLAITVYDDYY